MNKNRIRLSASQIIAIRCLQSNEKVFVGLNSSLHAATVKFLLKHKIAKHVEPGYISLCEGFKNSELI